MQKLLLILLCFPMIGYGQWSTNSKDYSPQFLGGFGGGNNDPNAEDILHFFDFPWNEIPDSLYGYSYFSPGGSGLPIWGYIKTHPGTIWISEEYADIAPFGTAMTTQTLNSNNQPFIITGLETGISNITTIDSIFYNSAGKKSSIVSRQVNGNQYIKKDFVYSGNNISEIHYYDDPNLTTPLQVDYVSYININYVSSIQTGNSVFEYYYDTNNLIQHIIYLYNGIFIDTIASYFYDINLLPEYCIEKQYNLENQSLDQVKKQELTHDTLNRFTSEKIYELENGNFDLTAEMNYIYYSSIGSIIENKKDKYIIKTSDLLGREIKFQTNQVIVEIYNDGTVEKKVVVE